MNKRKLIVSLTILSLIVLLVIVFTPSFATKKTYAITTNFAEAIITKAGNNTCDTAPCNGLYKVVSPLADGTTSTDYRYIGGEVDNYVRFNNDLYRIIGVFNKSTHGIDANLVKLIRSSVLVNAPYGIRNTSNSSGEYGGYSSDWSGTTEGVKTSANVLLNEYFYNKTDYSEEYKECEDWSYHDMTSTSADSVLKTNDCSNIVNYGIDSSVRDYIETVTWGLKGLTSTAGSKSSFYTCERSLGTTVSGCAGGYNDAYAESYSDEIGLMYASDYLYASGYYNSSDTTTTASSNYYFSSKNWLYKSWEWLLDPYGSSSSSNLAACVNESGGVLACSNGGTRRGFAVRPTFYLKSNVYLTGGTGTIDDPYTVACDDCTS